MLNFSLNLLHVHALKENIKMSTMFYAFPYIPLKFYCHVTKKTHYMDSLNSQSI